MAIATLMQMRLRFQGLPPPGQKESKHPLPQQPQQILPITILGQRAGQLLQRSGVNPTLVEGNFFGAGHFEALALF